MLLMVAGKDQGRKLVFRRNKAQGASSIIDGATIHIARSTPADTGVTPVRSGGA
jgi:hypothetical protein